MTLIKPQTADYNTQKVYLLIFLKFFDKNKRRNGLRLRILKSPGANPKKFCFAALGININFEANLTVTVMLP